MKHEISALDDYLKTRRESSPKLFSDPSSMKIQDPFASQTTSQSSGGGVLDKVLGFMGNFLNSELGQTLAAAGIMKLLNLKPEEMSAIQRTSGGASTESGQAPQPGGTSIIYVPPTPVLSQTAQSSGTAMMIGIVAVVFVLMLMFMMIMVVASKK